MKLNELLIEDKITRNEIDFIYFNKDYFKKKSTSLKKEYDYLVNLLKDLKNYIDKRIKHIVIVFDEYEKLKSIRQVYIKNFKNEKCISNLLNLYFCFEFSDYNKYINKLNKYDCDLLIYMGFNNLKSVINRKKIDGILGIETSYRNDFLHHRNSGINHILANMMNENNKIYFIDFNSILNQSKDKREIILGRVRQNVYLMKKNKVKIVCGNFVKDIFEIRKLNEIYNLLRL